MAEHHSTQGSQNEQCSARETGNLYPIEEGNKIARMNRNNGTEQKPSTEHFDTIVIGGGDKRVWRLATT
jgi:hypothetical protein